MMNTSEFRNMKESRRHGDALLPITQYCIRQGDGLSALDCHWHSEMELFCVMQGAVTIQCGTSVFEAHAGDIAFFNSGELHAAVPADNSGDLYFRAVVFSPDFLCGATNDILRVKYISPIMNGELQPPRLIRNGTPLHTEISGNFDIVYALLEQRPPLFEFRAKATMLALFGALVENSTITEISARQGTAAASIKKAIRYIQENYRAPLTVEKLAETAGMSEGHFCRVFKQYTLKTPVQFINSVRLTHAADQLSNTNKRVLDIAMDCGFNSVSYFIEVFRESFNITPSKYRKS
ncbi:MAG: helix-turn-helix transcriptional regulator [Clostridia bacterium]|nr:helix-turn-helix transcriptional regulator [Clostridia bacterium]